MNVSRRWTLTISRSNLLLTILFGLVGPSRLAAANSYGWKSPLSGDFSQPNNWTPAFGQSPGFPMAGDSASFGFFDSPHTYTVTCSGNASATTEVDDNVTFSLTGSYLPGDLSIGPSATVTGAGTLTASSITFGNPNAVLVVAAGNVTTSRLVASPVPLVPFQLVVTNGGQLLTSDTVSNRPSAIITGHNSLWKHTGSLQIANARVLDGAQFQADGCTNRWLIVGDRGSRVTCPTFATSTLTITNGGTVTSDTGALANFLPALIDGTGSSWTVSDVFSNALGGAGLLITGGGAMTANDFLDNGAGVTVADSGSTLTINGLLDTGTMQVTNAGTLLMNGSDVANTVFDIRDPSSTLRLNSTLTEPDASFGVLRGAVVSLTALKLAPLAATFRTLVVDGAGSQFIVSSGLEVGAKGSGSATVSDAGLLKVNGDFSIGTKGTGSLTVNTGGQVQSQDATIAGEGSTNSILQLAIVSDPGSLWVCVGDLTVGGVGLGRLLIDPGGEVQAANTTLGDEAGSTGTVSLGGFAGPRASLITADLTVGGKGQGSFTADSGAVVTDSGNVAIGDESGSTGTMIVTNTAIWNVTGGVTVGGAGSATLEVAAGPTLALSGSEFTVAEQSGGKGTALFWGGATAVQLSGELKVGAAGNGLLAVQNAAHLSAQAVTLGEQIGGKGSLTVDGASSLFQSFKDFTIGSQGKGTLVLTNSAAVVSGSDVTLADQFVGSGSAQLSAGTVWTLSGGLSVGSKGPGQVRVSGGAQLQALGASATLGEFPDAGGALTLDGRSPKGVPSTLLFAGTLSVGEQGSGTLTLTNGAVAQPIADGPGLVTLAPHPTGVGAITVSGAQSFLQATVMKVAVGEGQPGGQGTLALTANGQVNVGSEVETGGQGVVDVRGGSLTVGTTNLIAAVGTLQINAGGRLAGCGHIKGRVINEGGEVAPGCSPGTMTVEGDYTQTSAGALTIRFSGGIGGGASNDVLNVTGNAMLAGSLTLNFLDGFAPKQGQTFSFLQSGASLSTNLDQVVITGLAHGFQYQLSQPAAGTLSLTALNEGVATSPPLLSLNSTAGHLQISWPDTALGFVLETNADLGNPSGWQPFGGTVADTNGQESATINTAAGHSFFRLQHP